MTHGQAYCIFGSWRHVAEETLVDTAAPVRSCATVRVLVARDSFAVTGTTVAVPGFAGTACAFLDTGCVAPGTGCAAAGTGFVALGTRCVAPGAGSAAAGTHIVAHCTCPCCRRSLVLDGDDLGILRFVAGILVDRGLWTGFLIACGK